MTWSKRPYGFSVAPDEHGYNTVVSSIHSEKLRIDCGLTVGMAIAKINGTNMLGLPHDEVSHRVRNAWFPLVIEFSTGEGDVSCSIN